MRKQLMKCPHGRRERCTQCTPPKVTITGRAISPGRVTRASYGVRRGNLGKPLPVHLQCHPVALTPTPRNPGCATYVSYPVLALKLQNEHGTLWFSSGKGLTDKGKYLIEGYDSLGTYRMGYTDDPIYAKAWQSAAQHHGIHVDILED